MLERLLKLKYIILFLVVVYILIVTSVFIYYNYEKKIFLDERTELSKIEYEAVYQRTKEISETIFEEYINKKEIIDLFKNAHLSNSDKKEKIRKEIYNILKPSYSHLHNIIDLKQLHFHLPNNHSFLRMHRPNKFGDDLTKVRSTVEYVNKFKKKIDGFEEGRVYNGFRFVYPLFDENKVHIGSVEVSFSTALFQKLFSNDARYSQFILSKNISTKKVWSDEYKLNYTNSLISPDFLVESYNTEDKYTKIKNKILKSMPQEFKDTFKNNLSKENNYSLLLGIEGSEYIISFLPIKNPVTDQLATYLLVFSKNSHLSHTYLQNNILLLIAFSLLLSLFFIIYIKSKNDDELQEQKNILMEQSKMAQMGSMISNIAHQWKQPLARINSKLLEISILFNLSKEDKKMNKHLEDIEIITLHMANTIENFRTFFHPNKEKNHFYLSQTIKKAISLLNFDKSNIKIIFNVKDSVKIYCYENELIQVLMVLITNAKEAIEDNNITTNPLINITVVDKVQTVEISVLDNAGGIKDEDIKQIFNPYFSTKDTTDNSGIGLYMAKMIIEASMKGNIIYKRENDISNFTIILKGLNGE